MAHRIHSEKKIRKCAAKLFLLTPWPRVWACQRRPDGANGLICKSNISFFDETGGQYQSVEIIQERKHFIVRIGYSAGEAGIGSSVHYQVSYSAKTRPYGIKLRV